MTSKKEVEDALKEAKKLEADTIPTEKEIVEEYKKDMAKFDKIRQLLEPAWFISDKKDQKKKKKR